MTSSAKILSAFSAASFGVLIWTLYLAVHVDPQWAVGSLIAAFVSGGFTIYAADEAKQVGRLT